MGLFDNVKEMASITATGGMSRVLLSYYPESLEKRVQRQGFISMQCDKTVNWYWYSLLNGKPP